MGGSWCYDRSMTGDRRPYHHGNLREALLQAAETALEAKGVHSLAIRELCRELGVTHTSSRRHFADRRALLDVLAERGFARLGAALSDATRDRDRGFEERLTGLARVQIDFALRHPALYGWMFEAKNRPDAPPELLRASEGIFSCALAIFRDGQAAGALVDGDPQDLGLVAFAAVQGLVAISDHGEYKGVKLDALVGDVMTRIVLGLRPRGPAD